MHPLFLKVRSEALKKLTNIITEHKFITPNLGELPPALAPRLTDSNSRIANSALDFCEKLGPAMGTAGKKHIRTFFPGLLQVFLCELIIISLLLI